MFAHDGHRRLFLSHLGDAASRHGLVCHAYCLLDNHYHLILEARTGDLSAGMHRLLSNYTRQFNFAQGRDGPLWRDRFQSRLVDSDVYFLQLSRYVHRNALDVDPTKPIQRYRWSSMQFFAKPTPKPPRWFTTAPTLDHFSSRQRYSDFVRTPQAQDRVVETGISDDFGQLIWVQRQLDDIALAVHGRIGDTGASIVQACQILIACEWMRIPTADVGHGLGISGQATRSCLYRARQRARTDPAFCGLLASVRELIDKRREPSGAWHQMVRG